MLFPRILVVAVLAVCVAYGAAHDDKAENLLIVCLGVAVQWPIIEIFLPVLRRRFEQLSNVHVSRSVRRGCGVLGRSSKTAQGDDF